MATTELTNMIMIQDPDTGKVLIQDRIRSWKGWSFPGGHVEEQESFLDSAVREIKEETGLTVENLTPCGVIHWSHKKTGARYLVFCYKTSTFSGELIVHSEEGTHQWVTVEEFQNHPTENDAPRYLPLFLGECTEIFGAHDEDGQDPLCYV